MENTDTYTWQCYFSDGSRLPERDSDGNLRGFSLAERYAEDHTAYITAIELLPTPFGASRRCVPRMVRANAGQWIRFFRRRHMRLARAFDVNVPDADATLVVETADPAIHCVAVFGGERAATYHVFYPDGTYGISTELNGF